MQLLSDGQTNSSGEFDMRIKDLTFSAIFTAVTAVLAQITIPLPGGVPFTLQTFAVILAGLVLGKKRGAVSALIYVLLALVGVPVLAGLTGGPGAVFGVTGGFIITFPILAFSAGYGMETKNRWVELAGILIGVVLNYIAGVIWFSVAADRSMKEAVMLCVVPFLITDAIKIIMAYLLAPVLRRALQKASVL